MKLPRDLSCREVVDALVRKLDYRVVHERGRLRVVAAHKRINKDQIAALL